MIRELRKADINKVANIWLDTNITAHYFIPAQYWQNNFELVKELLLQATVYVYEHNQEIQGFIGLNDEYVEGIFVSDEMQSQGIGKVLLNYAKDKRSKLLLNVYQKKHGQYPFIKEKDLRFSIAVWMKLLEKKTMQWHGTKKNSSSPNRQSFSAFAQQAFAAHEARPSLCGDPALTSDQNALRAWVEAASSKNRSPLQKITPRRCRGVIFCRVLTKKMQEQSLVSQGFAGF